MKPRIKVIKPAQSELEGAEAAYEEITLAEQAHRRLRQDLISGDIPAGQPLRLEYLKERYGISFSPLREALNRLHSERLVVSTTSRGFRAAPFSEEEMWDAIETRIMIDCEALRRSLAKGDDEWEKRLVSAFHALIATARSRTSHAPTGLPSAAQEMEDRHLQFHRCLIAACGSRWLLDLSAQFYAQTERYRQPILRDARYWNLERDVATEHRELLDAAVARDAGHAAGLLARHYRETGRVVKQMLSWDEPAQA